MYDGSTARAGGARPLAASQIADLLLAGRLRASAPRVLPGEETFRDLASAARLLGSTAPAPPAPDTRSRPREARIANGSEDEGPGASQGTSPLSSRGASRRGISVAAQVALTALWALLTSAASASPASPTPDELLKLADRPKREFPEAVIHARITVTENGKTISPAEFELYRKGDDRSLVVFTAGRQKGRKILTVEDKVWLIVPGSSHAIAVTPNQRLMGGASLADVSKLRFSDEFDATSAGPPESVAGLACDVLKLSPKSAKSSYGGGTLWVDRRDHLARKAVVDLVSGKPAKEISFDRYGKQAGKIVLESMTIKDLLGGPAAGTTRIDYSNYRVAKIDDVLLTPEGALAF